MCNEVLEMIAINFIWLRDTVLQHFIKHHLDWNENFQINVFEWLQPTFHVLYNMYTLLS